MFGHKITAQVLSLGNGGSLILYDSPLSTLYHHSEEHCWLGVVMGHAADVAQGQSLTLSQAAGTEAYVKK